MDEKDLEGDQWTPEEIAKMKERPMPVPRMRISLEEAKKRFPPAALSPSGEK